MFLRFLLYILRVVAVAVIACMTDEKGDLYYRAVVAFLIIPRFQARYYDYEPIRPATVCYFFITTALYSSRICFCLNSVHSPYSWFIRLIFSINIKCSVVQLLLLLIYVMMTTYGKSKWILPLQYISYNFVECIVIK